MSAKQIFVERLRDTLEKRGINQVQLGKILAIKGSTISSYSVGHCFPSPDNLVKICDALGVSADYLLGRQD